MKRQKEIKNIKLYNYLSKFKTNIVSEIISKEKNLKNYDAFKRRIRKIKKEYLEDISKISTFDEIPPKWIPYLEKIETEKIKNNNY